MGENWSMSQVWWFRPEIPALWRPRQEDYQKIQVLLDYKGMPCLKKKVATTLTTVQKKEGRSMDDPNK